jgi:hypothetical protein
VDVVRGWLKDRGSRETVAGPAAAPRMCEVVTMRRAMILVTGAALAVAGTPGSAVAQESGRQQLAVVVRQELGAPQPIFSRVVASGVIDAVGTDRFLPSPDGDPNSYSRYVFRDGTLSITTTPDTFDLTQNPTSCIGRFTASGTWTISGGTGAYRGATGGGGLTAEGVVVAARTAQGCSEDRGMLRGLIRETGQVSLPGRGRD